MKFGYGLATGILVVTATAALALGQTPGQTPTKMGNMDKGKMGGHMVQMSGMMSHEEAAKTIAVMDHIWLNAARNRDAGTLEWLFANDFIEIHPGGSIVDGKEQIDQIKDTSRNIDEIHPDDIDVRYISPDAAVVLDTTTLRGNSGGVTYNGKYKVIRVFVREQGRWKAAGAGIAPIAP